MTVKILSSNPSFNAIQYNTDKMDKHTGELMLMANIPVIDPNVRLSPEEVKQYFKMVAKLNPKVKNPQFHATISCKGREYDKQQLTHIATQWIERMGYKNCPYIIVFHKDTDNNHVHIVSTRIGKDGEKIKDSYEYLLSQRHMDAILKIDRKEISERLLSSLECYDIANFTHFKILLEKFGFNPVIKGNTIKVLKSGELVSTYRMIDLEKRFQKYSTDARRINHLEQLLFAYANFYNRDFKSHHKWLSGKRKGPISEYTTELTERIKQDLGIEFILHFNKGSTPFDFTILDHTLKAVYNAGQLSHFFQLSERSSGKLAKTTVATKQEASLTMPSINQPIIFQTAAEDLEHENQRRKKKKNTT